MQACKLGTLWQHKNISSHEGDSNLIVCGWLHVHKYNLRLIVVTNLYLITTILRLSKQQINSLDSHFWQTAPSTLHYLVIRVRMRDRVPYVTEGEEGNPPQSRTEPSERCLFCGGFSTSFSQPVGKCVDFIYDESDSFIRAALEQLQSSMLAPSWSI